MSLTKFVNRRVGEGLFTGVWANHELLYQCGGRGNLSTPNFKLFFGPYTLSPLPGNHSWLVDVWRGERGFVRHTHTSNSLMEKSISPVFCRSSWSKQRY